MPKGTPEGARRNTGSGGSSGARGSSGSSSGAAARRTARVIKDINKPMSKASKQLAADATLARNMRMGNMTKKKPSIPAMSKAYLDSLDKSGTLSARYGLKPVPSNAPSKPLSSAIRATKTIRTTPKPSAPVSKSAAKKNAKALKNLGRLKTGM